jgi:succinate dehydrogenase / fumarate reductase cytochrome b subunit
MGAGVSTTATLDASRDTRRVFVSSRLGSLLAVAPLGVWTVNHVWDNLAAFQGPAAWQRAVTEHPHPVAHGVTLAIVLLPLALHTVWGIARLRSTQPNNTRYGFFANLRYLLQRVSAVGVLFFLGAHLWLAMIKPRFFEGHAEAFADIAHEMHHHGPTLAVYALGTLGVAYHLANGIGTFAMGWGLAASRKSIRTIERLSIVFFLVLLCMSWAVLYAMWRAGA